ncbi:MAG TPA: BREX-2 system adenine-specific DNA-methyltransferase PglX [Streptosporangiaceae bacterium]|nr:BREX-2 system adenine-specific DNA-methyltransferase PglX [Streptosporangiaceae bacterium]
MTATPALTTDLQSQVLLLEGDLRNRLANDSEREADWKREHQQALTRERTAAPWVTWRDDRITQAAVAWVLTSVFIRFCEDNALVAPVWIAGPERRRQEALDAQLAFFRAHPEDTDREWLQSAIDHLAGLPATKALVNSHSALHLVSPSGDTVTKLLDFWRKRGDDGALIHDLQDPSLSTRFLGDLYQDLSQHAKDTYALLQTPVFVEEFILDRTLEPALKERPLEGFKLIDPTCGSGHFLLGTFDRLLDRWHRHAPGLELQARVQSALDSIHGVDLNPFAVAIARFRLTVAALQASGLTSLEKAPAFTLNLAVGDSLIHGPDVGVLEGMADRTAFMPFTYTTEDGPLLLTMLEEGTYDVVVGNPPYITVKDKALNKIYRSKYTNVCKGTYALTAPFMVEFFALAKHGEQAGWIGQITSNSFMKREFGTKLIEDFLAHKDLRLVADTSGAYIPGHGTPTVIIVGRNQRPTSSAVRAVLGVRGEPGRPDNAAKGFVWTSIVGHVEDPGWDDDWVTVTNLDRKVLAVHPWILSGGGALDVAADIERIRAARLGIGTASIGRTTASGEDEAFFVTRHKARSLGLEGLTREIVIGECVRDYAVNSAPLMWWPYEDMEGRHPVSRESPLPSRVLWPYRTGLSERVIFGKTLLDQGRPWYEHLECYSSKLGTERGVGFAFVATHNHFTFDKTSRLFNRTAPVIKLARGATEGEHLALLGVLNSSVACFWLKQNSHNKGRPGAEQAGADEPWEHRFEFTATTLEDYPLPERLPIERGRVLDKLAKELAQNTPAAVAECGTPSAPSLAEAHSKSDEIRARMVGLQEELDWEVYGLYRIVGEDLTYEGDDLPTIEPGERAFAIAMARAVAAGEWETTWFSHHNHKFTPITEIPDHWPAGYRDLVKRRLDLIASDPAIRLLERSEYKRRWAQESWEKRQEWAVREWLLDRLEERRFWFDSQGRPLPRSVGQLADEVGHDADLVSVLGLWEGRPDVPVMESLVRLLADEGVPFLAASRYKDSGLRKREAWEETWALQRREDAGEKVGTIPVPPKYTSADFRKPSYWQARGKLDVPKERFILYPDAGRETDPTPLLGWAGWDHAQQSLALLRVIGEREQEGWAEERLVPLVAGLAELQPWVEQWHGEVDPEFGVSLAAFCAEQLTARAAGVGKTLAELAAWLPVPATRGRRARNARS